MHTPQAGWIESDGHSFRASADHGRGGLRIIWCGAFLKSGRFPKSPSRFNGDAHFTMWAIPSQRRTP